MDLKEVKEYLRIDDASDVEDDLLRHFMAVAEGYIRDAVSDYDEKKTIGTFLSKSEMCQLAIIAELYENRNQGVRESTDFRFAIRSMITQLQYMPIPEGAT